MNTPVNKSKIVVLISGRGSNLKSIIDDIKKNNRNYQIALVLSNKKDAKGLEHAKENSIPTLVLERQKGESSQDYSQRLADSITPYDPHLVVLAGFMVVVKKNFIEQLKGKVINIHPSLLPSFKGLNAQKQALEYGVKITGCTTHYVSEKIDSGQIIAQKAVEVKKDDTEESLSKRILKQEHILITETIQILLQ